jgi:hypothetical protein
MEDRLLPLEQPSGTLDPPLSLHEHVVGTVDHDLDAEECPEECVPERWHVLRGELEGLRVPAGEAAGPW